MNNVVSLVRAPIAVLIVVGTVCAQAAPARAECSMANCGGNSPKLYGQDINGLNLRGRPNQDGHRLVVDSVRLAPRSPAWWPQEVRALDPCFDAGPPGSARLGIVDDELVVYGRSGDARKTFTGPCLVGATFVVEVMPERAAAPKSKRAQVVQQPPAKRIVVAIAHVDHARTFHSDRFQGKQLAMYEFVVGPDRRPMCEHKQGLMDRTWQSTACPRSDDGCAGVSTDESARWTVDTDFAFVAGGEVTQDTDDGFQVWKQGPDWFQIACAGSAVSKLLLLGQNFRDPNQWSLRRATLNMLAARYDGQTTRTVPGMPLDYQRVNASMWYFGWPTGEIYEKEPEAYWSERGALCVSHLRTWVKPGAVVAGTPTSIGGLVQMGSTGVANVDPNPALSGGPADEPADLAQVRASTSPPLPACIAGHPPEGAVWMSQVVDHIPHDP